MSTELSVEKTMVSICLRQTLFLCCALCFASSPVFSWRYYRRRWLGGFPVVTQFSWASATYTGRDPCY